MGVMRAGTEPMGPQHGPRGPSAAVGLGRQLSLHHVVSRSGAARSAAPHRWCLAQMELQRPEHTARVALQVPERGKHAASGPRLNNEHTWTH